MKIYAVPKYLFNAELAKIVARAIVLRLKSMQDKKRKAEEAWKEYIKIVTPHEDRFRRILKKLFKAQEQEVLRNMRRSSKSLVITKDKINTWLFDEKEWKEKFGRAEEDFLAGLATEVGNQTVESLPVVGMMFDVNNPNLRKRMDKRVGEFKGVVDTTTRKIRDSLTAGIDAGESIDELADRVINVFKDASYNRAEMIARTETIWGSNAATESTYMQSGVVEGKEWQVALDERLCEFCMHMYEHYGPGTGGIRLGEKFFDKGDSLILPQDLIFPELGDKDITSVLSRDKHSAEGGYLRDNWLESVVKMQGMDGKPKILSEEDFGKYEGKSLFRGVKKSEFVHEFKHGKYFPGSGVYGNGHYFAGGDLSKAEREALSYSAGKKEGLIKAKLHPKAKVIDWNDLKNEMEETGKKISEKYSFRNISEAVKNGKITEKEADLWLHYPELMADPGRYCALRGYDAIKVNISDDLDYYVVVNRTKVVTTK